MTNQKNTKTFEEAYERLEQILEKMNEQQVPLDDALKLYEEADQLITSCQKKLAEAEQKIVILQKNREKQLELNEEGKPKEEAFIPSQYSSLK